MLTPEQVEYANEVLDWYNTRISEIMKADPWARTGRDWPNITVRKLSEVLNQAESLLSEVHTMDHDVRCGCGKCGR